MGCITTSPPETVHLFKGVCNYQKLLIQLQEKEPPVALGQISLFTTFAKACWGSFVEVNAFGSAVVLLEEKKKFGAYKMNMLKRYSQLSVMKPRCKEL